MRGEHIGFSADPVGVSVRVGVGVTDSCSELLFAAQFTVIVRKGCEDTKILHLSKDK